MGFKKKNNEEMESLKTLVKTSCASIAEANSAKNAEDLAALEAKDGEIEKLKKNAESLQTTLDGSLIRNKEAEETIANRDREIEEQQLMFTALQKSLDGAHRRQKEYEEKVQSRDREIQEKNAEVQKFKSIMASTENILSDLQTQVELGEQKKKAAVEETHNLLSNAENEIGDLKTKVESLHEELNQLSNSKAEMQKQLMASQEKCTELESRVVSLKKASENSEPANDTPVQMTNGQEDEISKLKDRLEKEKSLTKSLGEAAGRLTSVLKQTQDQLQKEKEKNKELARAHEDESEV